MTDTSYVRGGETLTAKQQQAVDLYRSDARHILLYGGSRSAKTFLHLRYIMMRAITAAGSRHIIARFRRASMKNTIIQDWPKVLSLCFPGVVAEENKADGIYIFQNGSKVFLVGLDEKQRTEKILGADSSTIFINEASEVSYTAFDTAQTRLSQQCEWMGAVQNQQGKIIQQKTELRQKFLLDMNPPDTGHWTYKLFIEKVMPISGKPLVDPENYVSLLMNPLDNLENLGANYIKSLDNKDRAGRDRFFLGKFRDVRDNALWSHEMLDKHRVSECPRLLKIVIGVDPSGAGKKTDDSYMKNDAIGIVVMGLGIDGNGYVLEDLTCLGPPEEWGKVVADAYSDERHGANTVVGEVNFGGDMVRAVIQAADPRVHFVGVRASRNKQLRAEPISALHGQGRIKLVGFFPELEDELVSLTRTGYVGLGSPDRADAFVFAASDLFPGMTKPAQEEYHAGYDFPPPPIGMA